MEHKSVISSFNISAYLLPVFIVLCGAVPFFVDFLMINEPKNSSSLVFKVVMSVFSLVLMLFGVYQFIYHIVKIEITEKEIAIRKNLGFGRKMRFTWGEIDGFEIVERSSRSEKYEVLHVRKNKRIVIRVSQFYLSNYSEIKKVILMNLSKVGE